jgi:hypothetical protein
MLERFRRGGLTRRAFAERHGVPLSTLASWLARSRSSSATAGPKGRSRGSSTKPPPVLFGEVEWSGALSAPSPEWALEVVSSRGLVIRFREAPSMGQLERLLKRC